jgi:hypothetical protein
MRKGGAPITEAPPVVPNDPIADERSVDLVFDLVCRVFDLVFEVVVVVAGNTTEAEGHGNRER